MPIQLLSKYARINLKLIQEIFKLISGQALEHSEKVLVSDVKKNFLDKIETFDKTVVGKH